MSPFSKTDKPYFLKCPQFKNVLTVQNCPYFLKISSILSFQMSRYSKICPSKNVLIFFTNTSSLSKLSSLNRSVLTSNKCPHKCPPENVPSSKTRAGPHKYRRTHTNTRDFSRLPPRLRPHVVDGVSSSSDIIMQRSTSKLRRLFVSSRKSPKCLFTWTSRPRETSDSSSLTETKWASDVVLETWSFSSVNERETRRETRRDEDVKNPLKRRVQHKLL